MNRILLGIRCVLVVVLELILCVFAILFWIFGGTWKTAIGSIKILDLENWFMDVIDNK